jgi:type IV pilus assembly protein PilA
MLYRLRQRSQDEGGFTLIELLVVILIIGILAAIAIPSFLNQKGKAYDASAKELARTAETTAETYATDHGGEYTSMSTGELGKYETGLKTCATNPPKENACLLSVGKATSNEYEVTTEAVNTGDKFSITRNSSGEISRTCKSTTGSKTGCSGSESGSW